MSVKGLLAAGGEATRLGELTRVVNKRAGVAEVEW